MCKDEYLTEMCEMAARANLCLLHYVSTEQQALALRAAIDALRDLAPGDITPHLPFDRLP